MKKIFFIMLTLSVIAFASCSNDDNILEPQERITAEVNDSVLQIVQQNLELSKLQSNINSYNFNYIEKQNPNTRSIKNFFKNFFRKPWKLIATIAADAVGGVFGGVAGGVTASGIVGCAVAFEVTKIAIVPMPNNIGARHILGTTGGINIPDSLLNSEEVIFGNVVPDNSYMECYANDSIGYYHNKILYEIFSDDAKLDEFMNMDKQAQAYAIVEEMKNTPYLRDTYGSALDNTTNINNGIIIAEAVIELAETAETEDEFFDGLANLGITDANVIAVMKEVLNGLYNIDPTTDSGEYYQDVLEIVENSNLDINMKQKFADGIIIGQASNHLWKKVPLDYGSSEEGLGAQ